MRTISVPRSLSQFTTSPPSWYAYIWTWIDGGQMHQLARHVHQFLMIDTSGPSSLDSVTTGGDLHRTRCMESRVHGRAIPISTERLHTMSKSFASLSIDYESQGRCKIYRRDFRCQKRNCPQS